METHLLAGVSEVEITPPVGTPLCGSLKPRPSQGVEDPLYVKALVLDDGKTRLAYVIFDLALLKRADGDEAVRLASERTGIPPEHIVWSCTHTHTGPYTAFEAEMGGGVVDRHWLKTLPEKCARCVGEADRRKVPARVCRARGYQPGLTQTRRYRFKDGRHVNAWLVNRGEEDIQCIGATSPVDPEVGVLTFETPGGEMLAILFHFTLHANTNFGPLFSADYPAVVASRMRERFGPQVCTLFAPGACGDQNATESGHRRVGDALAEVILASVEKRRALPEPVRLGACKRRIAVPCHDLDADQEEKLRASQWSAEEQDFFRGSLQILRRQRQQELKALLQAWHVGEVAFASLPGEPFVEWGFRLKENSPFPWTYMVELGGDSLGYLITPQAWEGGGYESLVSCVSQVAPEGVERMVQEALDMLAELHARSGRS